MTGAHRKHQAQHDHEYALTISQLLEDIDADPAPDQGHRHLTLKVYARDRATVIGQLEISLDVADLVEWSWMEIE